MLLYQVIETDDGLVVAESQPGTTPEEVAVARGGILMDPGPYTTFDDAYDAMLALQKEQEEDEQP
jgi:hypothetical protein